MNVAAPQEETQDARWPIRWPVWDTARDSAAPGRCLQGEQAMIEQVSTGVEARTKRVRATGTSHCQARRTAIF